MRYFWLFSIALSLITCTKDMVQLPKLTAYDDFGIDSEDNIWFTRNDKLFRAKMTKLDTSYTYQLDSFAIPNASYLRINDIEIGSDDAIWLATKKGMFRFKDQIWETFNAENSCLVFDHVQVVKVDETEMCLLIDAPEGDSALIQIINLSTEDCKTISSPSVMTTKPSVLDKRAEHIWVASNGLYVNAPVELVYINLIDYSSTVFDVRTSITPYFGNIYIDHLGAAWYNMFTSDRTKQSEYHKLYRANINGFGSIENLKPGSNFALTEGKNDELWIAQSPTWSYYDFTRYEGGGLYLQSGNAFEKTLDIDRENIDHIEMDSQGTLWYIDWNKIDFFKF